MLVLILHTAQKPVWGMFGCARRGRIYFDRWCSSDDLDGSFDNMYSQAKEL